MYIDSSTIQSKGQCWKWKGVQPNISVQMVKNGYYKYRILEFLWPQSLQFSWIRFCAFYVLPNIQRMYTIWMSQRMWKTFVRTGSPTLQKNNLYENKNTITIIWCGLMQMLLASRWQLSKLINPWHLKTLDISCTCNGVRTNRFFKK